MIYLDNSATTKVHPDVLEAMMPYLQEEYGNASSKHYTLAENSRNAIEDAREHVAKLIGCKHDEVVFTSGSTESNNMILKGVMDYYQYRGKQLVVSKVEHSSILETAEYLKSKGNDVVFLDVDQYGRVKIDDLEKLFTTDGNPLLVSIIWGNNETGSLNPIDSIATLCCKHNVFFHTDATQVLGKYDVRNVADGLGFLSCSAHKLHGPKGIGACIVKKDHQGIKTRMTPLIHGGGQEFDYRSGTLSTHNIVGFGKAAEIALHEINETRQILEQLELQLRMRLNEYFSEILSFNSDDSNKIPGVINVRFKDVDNEFLVKELGDRVALSSGSACSSTKPSHVLRGMGLNLEQIRSSIRISLSRFNTTEEINEFCRMLAGY
ncbi:cysteine desulfurase family protein [Paenibacillus sp. YYML68]|uniref:cysteine desulfurase family protein n=1 Tax=Paenibacillus sp. YYML68 TaxID=2909250 RepID=UPI002491C024|nr:cysteine desulfurase family protein [Paenibacillus sp. YYML68]